MRAADAGFQGWTCHAPEARLARMTALILDSIDRPRVRRILDLGCGAGAQLRQLAREFPEAVLTGVDISEANIRSAEKARAAEPSGGRMQFVRADYMAFVDAPFDLIVSDGVLHFIDVAPERLVSKMAGDLTAGGTLVVAMATDCLYNRAIAVARRALRSIRGRPVDAAILRLARAVHGSRMSDAMLAERIPYLYMAPHLLMGPRLVSELEASGMRHVATYEMPRTSAAELTHAVGVFRRASSPGTGGAAR